MSGPLSSLSKPSVNVGSGNKPASNTCASATPALARAAFRSGLATTAISPISCGVSGFDGSIATGCRRGCFRLAASRARTATSGWTSRASTAGFSGLLGAVAQAARPAANTIPAAPAGPRKSPARPLSSRRPDSRLPQSCRRTPQLELGYADRGCGPGGTMERITCAGLVVGAALTIGVLAAGAGAPGSWTLASFNCRQATGAAERGICADPQLAMLDRKLAAAYQQRLAADPSVRVIERG